ncbi:hypothetical protein B0H13DRAFT_1896559 [Mycena leptocephala]|nr:hypothetical protein B0H13DRAFT_1896559 [Mycena leptocephala]
MRLSKPFAAISFFCSGASLGPSPDHQSKEKKKPHAKRDLDLGVPEAQIPILELLGTLEINLFRLLADRACGNQWLWLIRWHAIVVKKQRWSCATSYIRPPQQPQPPVNACLISHRVASGGCRDVSN